MLLCVVSSICTKAEHINSHRSAIYWVSNVVFLIIYLLGNFFFNIFMYLLLCTFSFLFFFFLKRLAVIKRE